MSRARTIMTRNLVTISPDDTLENALAVLDRRGITGAPVVADSGRLVGVISYTDLARSLGRTHCPIADFYLRWPPPEGAVSRLPADAPQRVREVMSTPITVEEDTWLEDVAARMLDHHIHRILVTDADQLVGLISSMDFVRMSARADARVDTCSCG